VESLIAESTASGRDLPWSIGQYRTRWHGIPGYGSSSVRIPLSAKRLKNVARKCPADSVLVFVDRLGVRPLPGVRLPYVPDAVSEKEPDPNVFADAEADEFRLGHLVAAIAK
jgi:hypothetical protein